MPEDFNEPKNEKDFDLEDEYFESLSSLIYPVRGVKVMLDYELAELYGYETKRFNTQINNNIMKFDDTFRFKLTKEEWYEILRCKKCTSSLLKQKDLKSILMSKNSTSSLEFTKEELKELKLQNNMLNKRNSPEINFGLKSWGGRRRVPYAFTEEGIYMLMTVLKGELATKQSILLIKTFKRMKDFIIANSNLLTTNEVLDLHTIVRSHDNRISNLENNFNMLTNSLNEKKTTNHYLIINGHRMEGNIAYQEIYSRAKHSIFVIDDYVDIKTLQLLKCCKNNVEIKIFTDNKAQNSLTREFLADFISDTHLNIGIKSNGGIFHDRYIVIDYGYKAEELFHSGPSSKDVGNGVGTIVKIADIAAYCGLINKLLETSKDIFKDNL